MQATKKRWKKVCGDDDGGSVSVSNGGSVIG